MPRILLVSLLVFGLSACDANAEPSTSTSVPQPKTAAEPETSPAAVRAESLSDDYTWLRTFDAALDVVRLSERFVPPRGFERVVLEEGSFGQFLRGLPVRTDRRAVLSYRGAQLSSPSAAIIAMDVGARDLQQCADTAIRLHAEYLWSTGQHDKLGYHFTSGDETRWRDWKNGERYVISGSKVTRVERGAVASIYPQFRRWLDTVFMYAGTRSLRFDSQAVDGAIEPGDFFVAPGSPGHAVIVLDIAENTDGERLALLGQGFMPAQELHVIRARGDGVRDKVWFVLPTDGEKLDTPSWQAFSRSEARRFKTQ